MCKDEDFQLPVLLIRELNWFAPVVLWLECTLPLLALAGVVYTVSQWRSNRQSVKKEVYRVTLASLILLAVFCVFVLLNAWNVWIAALGWSCWTVQYVYFFAFLLVKYSAAFWMVSNMSLLIPFIFTHDQRRVKREKRFFWVMKRVIPAMAVVSLVLINFHTKSCVVDTNVDAPVRQMCLNPMSLDQWFMSYGPDIFACLLFASLMGRRLCWPIIRTEEQIKSLSQIQAAIIEEDDFTAAPKDHTRLLNEQHSSDIDYDRDGNIAAVMALKPDNSKPSRLISNAELVDLQRRTLLRVWVMMIGYFMCIFLQLLLGISASTTSLITLVLCWVMYTIYSPWIHH